ncbi:MAG: helix-turn-helix domain-containing protein [Acholeplasmataceae bacterium]
MNDIKLYTIEEVSEILKVTPRTIYNFIKFNHLKAVKIGKYWRVTEKALQDFISEGTNKS